ncbi:hypothetical protein BH11BAC5_BH11BAC5_47510 [soil metagenome]
MKSFPYDAQRSGAAAGMGFIAGWSPKLEPIVFYPPALLNNFVGVRIALSTFIAIRSLLISLILQLLALHMICLKVPG